MKITALFSLLLLFKIGSSQDYSTAEFGQSICDKYLAKGTTETPQKIEEGVKSGYWTYYYDKDGSLTGNMDSIHSYLIIELKEDYPISTGCYCNKKGQFEGYTNFKKGTWNHDSTSVWYDKKGRLEVKEKYNNDTLMHYQEFSKKGFKSYSEKYTYINSDTLLVTTYSRADGSTIIHEETLNGVEHGNYYITYPDGSKKVEAVYKNGVRIKDLFYYKNGIVQFDTECRSKEEACCTIRYNKLGEKVDEYASKYRVVSRVTR